MGKAVLDFTTLQQAPDAQLGCSRNVDDTVQY